MQTMTILAALLMGQCMPGQSCYRVGQQQEIFGPTFMRAAPAPVIDHREELGPNAGPRTRHRVLHDGFYVTVEGYQIGDGEVRWFQDCQLNINAKAALDKAIAARRIAAAKADRERAERAALKPSPAARVEPKPAEPAREPEPLPAPLPPPVAQPPAVPAGTLPTPSIQQKGAIPNYGVDFSRMKGFETYTTDSDEAKQFVAEAAAEAGGPSKLHLTVIGKDEERAVVMADIDKGPLAAYKDILNVQGYKPGDFAIDPKLGFKSEGKPSIYLQEGKGPGDPRGGRVIYRSLDYSGGPNKIIAAIRKARPDYNPANDPGPANAQAGGKCPLGFTKDDIAPAVLVALVVLLILKLPRKAG